MIVEKAMAPHSSTLAWKILWTEESGRLQSMGSLRVGHDWMTSLSLFTFMHWRSKRQPTLVFLPGESQGRGSLVSCCLWGRYDIEHLFMYLFSSVHLLSRVQLCNPMNWSMPGFPIHHQLPEPAQTHVHQIGDAIQPFHPLSAPSPPAFNLSQHQGLFQWVSSSHLVAKAETGVSASASVLPMNTRDWSPLGWTNWISLQSKGLSRVFSNTKVQKHQFFGIHLSL